MHCNSWDMEILTSLQCSYGSFTILKLLGEGHFALIVADAVLMRVPVRDAWHVTVLSWLIHGASEHLLWLLLPTAA